MATQVIVVGPLQVNCFVVACEATHQALIIDPGDEPTKILHYLSQNRLTADYILLTHGHFDHLGAAAELARRTGASVLAHPADQVLIEQASMHAALFGLPPPEPVQVDQWLTHGQIIEWGQLKGRVMETPGHSPGSISLLVDNQVFVGDVLFSRSIGRTDLPGGSYETLIRSIKEVLMALPDEVVVHCGHGPSTTIGRERRFNPFIA
ncbi:MAG: MBL fold metallo-hydrolase [candidate division KSB1 bacterium]|nr:MBL fold metallo-hydrolase [candidate division KSB1 bacterium]